MAEAMGMGKPPGVYFTYELSPIQVSYSETRPSMAEFLTSACAIIGGVFSLSGRSKADRCPVRCDAARCPVRCGAA
eukprot:9501231-Pyramimonas_sp.AAC.1